LNEAVTVVPHGAPIAPVQRLTATDIVARTLLVQEVMKAVMKKDVHYGVVPGTDKPSLLQPGAEKLLMAFQLAPELEVDDLSISGEVARYRVRARIRHVPTDEVVGEGVGECSTDEEKYRWKKAVCDEEFLATPIDRRREKWRASDRGKYVVKQIRTEPADLANTVLKMAKKRALVDGAKSTCAASDVFEQDLEDLEKDLIERSGDDRRPPEAPKRKEAATTAPAAPAAKAADAGSESPKAAPAEKGKTLIPDERWQAVRDQWHTRGTISEQQQKRLFGKAMSAGWTSPVLKAELENALGIQHSREFPSGKPYDLACALIEEFKQEQRS
jgi:hypothetical protein